MPGDQEGLNLKTAYEQNKEQIKKIQKKLENAELKKQFNAVCNEIKSLNDKMSSYCKRDRHGIFPKLTAADQAMLMKLYDNFMKLSDNFTKIKRDDKLLEPAQNLLKELMDKASQDKRVLTAYTPDKKQLSLPALLDIARKRTVDITGHDIKGKGGALSSRLPFTYHDPNGNIYSGFFTKQSFSNYEKGLEDLFNDINKEEANKQYGFNADTFLDSFFEIYGEQLKAKGRNIDSLPKVGKQLLMGHELFNFETVEPDFKKVSEAFLKVYYHQHPEIAKKYKDSLDDPKDPFYDERNRTEFEIDQIVLDFCDKFGPLYRTSAINYQHGIRNGDRIDTRNSAMTAVADLLGKGKLIAKSISMNVKDGDEVIPGTFMENAEGMDLHHVSEYATKYTEENFGKSNGLKDLADMQVLDYICGNVDRHVGNMLYSFDSSDPDPANHKFKGVQGIDNDCSFGLDVPKDRSVGAKLMVPINNMRVISQSMYNAVQALTPDALKFQLRDMKLRPIQIECACKRLTQLQTELRKDVEYFKTKKDAQKDPTYLEKDRVRVIPDNKFAELDISKLATKRESHEIANNKYNIFDSAKKFVEYREFDPFAEEKEAEEISNKSRVSVSSSYKYSVEADDWYDRTDEVTKNNKTSPEFEDLKAMLGKYKKFADENNGHMMDFDTIMSRNKYLKAIQKKCDVYLDHKKKDFITTKYAQSRIDAVKQIKEEAAKSLFLPNDAEKEEIRTYERERTSFLAEQTQKAIDKTPVKPEKTSTGKVNEQIDAPQASAPVK